MRQIPMAIATAPVGVPRSFFGKGNVAIGRCDYQFPAYEGSFAVEPTGARPDVASIDVRWARNVPIQANVRGSRVKMFLNVF